MIFFIDHLNLIISNFLHSPVMRKFVFVNKEKIKREIRLTNQVIPILEFMIERGAVHGYLLRESIL